MTELQKVLYDYAWEYQIPGLLRASQKEAADNDRMVEAALTRLRGLGPEGADLAQRLESGQLTRQAIQGEAVFLAGLSLGLELGAAAACERRTAVMPALRTGTTCWPR